MTNIRAKALEAVEFCLSVIGNPRIPKEDTAIWSCGTSSKPRITMDILETIREALSEPRQLTTIAAILQRWIDFDTDARNKEGLETTDDTHIMAPPTWPSHGQLKNWIATLSEPKWKSMDSAPMDGTGFYARFETPMRWLPYKGNSQQFKSGIKGRWQMMSEYGGWENTEYVPIEWRPHEDDIPPPPTGD